MLHVDPSTPAIAAAPPAFDPIAYRAHVLCAEQWLAGAQECGLVVFPWPSHTGQIVMHQCGREMDGPNDFSAATARFLKHPAVWLRKGLPRDVLHDVLCADFGVEPGDPQFCAKVNARLAADHVTRDAGDIA